MHGLEGALYGQSDNQDCVSHGQDRIVRSFSSIAASLKNRQEARRSKTGGLAGRAPTPFAAGLVSECTGEPGFRYQFSRK
jgi:hypothetical protein